MKNVFRLTLNAVVLTGAMAAVTLSSCSHQKPVVDTPQTEPTKAGNPNYITVSIENFCGIYCAEMYLVDLYKKTCHGKDLYQGRIVRTEKNVSLDLVCEE